ncbi:MAG: TIGR00180 family glycosyltransferase [Candidatus Omnitrophica bacterium]|nr:TIGR00180 family glycosyltransferase [Candidatus Omnitrophota bacterium]
MKCQDITLLVPTYNRPLFLLRVLATIDLYGFTGPVMVLDSSTMAFDATEIKKVARGENVTYERFPGGMTLYQKLFEISGQIKTPYVVCVGDDDLRILSFLEKAVRFLDEHPDYSAVHGEALLFRMENGKVRFVSEYSQRDVFHATPSARLADHLGTYSTTFYSVQRTKDFILSMRIWNRARPGFYNYDEILMSCILAICGKLKYMKGLCLLRQVHQGMDSAENIPERDSARWITSEGFYSGYQIFSQELCSLLMERDGVSRQAAESLIERAFLKYMYKNLQSVACSERASRPFQIKTRWFKEALRGGYSFFQAVMPFEWGWKNMGTYMNPFLRYAKDFVPIRKFIDKFPVGC